MPHIQARRIHEDLVDALDRLRRAERSAVTLFARILEDDLFRDLGYATIELYGTEGLGLSRGKTRHFLRLARSLGDLPATRQALDSGELPWTKARTLASVLTPRTEGRWLQEAARLNSRQLEDKVRMARRRGRRERDRLRRRRGQGALALDTPELAPAPEVPVTASLVMSPLEHTRYEGLFAFLQKHGDRRSRVDQILDGLSVLASNENPRGISATPYQVVAYRCSDCNKTTVHGREITPAASGAVLCDTLHLSRDPRQPNRHSVPPSVRRAVLARDGHRCSTEGCSAVHRLEVHHILPRSAGGPNDAENLITLCAACHLHLHERSATCPGPETPAPLTCPP